MKYDERCKTIAINNYKNSIDDLSDDILLDILRRLPHYSTALKCKAVSKRWCALVSDPLFVARGFSIHTETDKDDQPWTSLLIDSNHQLTAIVAKPYCESVLRSPTLSLDFLPKPFTICSTFRDLVLCFNVNRSTEVGQFYVCNLLTKQWITLPPTQTDKEPEWAGLVCQKGSRFRVVVLRSITELLWAGPFKNYHLVIYISETREWKNIDLRIDEQPCLNFWYNSISFTGVVCKSMVCFCEDLYFGAFNPFEVTSTFNGTLTAITVPLPTTTGGEKLLESCGKLIATNQVVGLSPWHETSSYTDLVRFPIWKLDLNQLESINEQALEWELVSDFNDSIVVQPAIINALTITAAGRNGVCQVLDVHPNKEHLVYLRMSGEKHLLVIFDTEEKYVKVSTQLEMPSLRFLPCHSLLQGWPMPIPIPSILPASDEIISNDNVQGRSGQ